VGSALVQEVSGIISLLRGLSEGVGPSTDRVTSYSLFYTAVVKQCEFFITATEKQVAKKSGKLNFVEGKILFGRAALLYKWDELLVAEVYVGPIFRQATWMSKGGYIQAQYDKQSRCQLDHFRHNMVLMQVPRLGCGICIGVVLIVIGQACICGFAVWFL
jgi:hypothetical protein